MKVLCNNHFLYATSHGLGESGLPALLDMYLYHHDVWVLVESYAQQQLHSSTRMLLAMEAVMLLHTKGLNWNANDTMRHLFLQVNALALPVAMAAAGLDIDGGEMATAEDLEQVAAESEEALSENVAEDAAGGCYSFTAATPVTTAHGKQAIGTLQAGEKVLAYNPRTHRMELESILNVWISHDHDLVDLTLTTIVPGQHGKPATRTSEVIHTNQKHPFFTEEKGFLPVGQITLGMHVLRADDSYGVVTGWRRVPGASVMYNLEVAQDHTFTVGAGQWVVHSGGSCGDVNSSSNTTDQGIPDPTDRLNDLGPTLERIDAGERFPHRNDGSVFQNREGQLPSQPNDYYYEYVVPTPGIAGPRPKRLVLGNGGEIYYTEDHYRTFEFLSSGDQ